MMISRRGFLKGLLSLPLVAAVAQFKALAEVLPVVDPPEVYVGLDVTSGSDRAAVVRGQWLRINGVPVQCISVTVDHDMDYIEACDPETGDRFTVEGIRTNTLTVRLIEDMLRPMFYAQEKLDIEAMLGPAWFRAIGVLISHIEYLEPGGLFYSDATIHLLDVRYEPA